MTGADEPSTLAQEVDVRQRFQRQTLPLAPRAASIPRQALAWFQGGGREGQHGSGL